MTQPVAEGCKAVGEVATKSDLRELRAELKSDVAEVKAELSALRAELKSEVSGLRAELKGDTRELRGELKGDIASLRNSTAQWIISAVFLNILTVVGAVAAVWQLARR